MQNLMTNTSLLLSILIFSNGCSYAPITGDRKLKGKEIPAFLSEYKKPEFHDAEFFEKSSLKNKSYEVKYYHEGREVSLAFNHEGRLIEKEVDTDLNALPDDIRKKIVQYMDINYPGHVVLEVELRQEDQTQDFIDVEIRHKSSKSGYWELSFTPDGEYVSRELEEHTSIETLN